MGNYESIDVSFDGSTYPFNYNPVHAIWQCFLMIGLPESWLDSTSFLEAAQTIYNEDKGVSVYMQRHETSLNYIKSLLSHINGVIFYGVSGKIHIRLLRDDYTVSNLPVIEVDDLLEDPSIERGSWTETYGEVKIQYTQLTKPVTTQSS